MTQIKVDPFDKHSLHYKKWLIKIRYADFKKPIYLVWLTDTLDNEDDKILINANGQLIGSNKADTLVNYIIGTKHKLFDSRLTGTWAAKIKGIKSKPYVTYDFNKILSTRKTIDKDGLEEIANFINLFTDFVTTTKENKLERLRRKRDLKEIWEYYYSNIFWPRFNDPKKFKTFKVKGYKSSMKLQSTLQKMTQEFVKRIEIVQ
ncbi:MAG: hypothetical protein C0490_05215 [Marivirga sp.]|nr:hypothetical protein [Marivirga sp.]